MRPPPAPPAPDEPARAGAAAVEIAATLRELAGYLELEGDAHRARAYRKAADTVGAIHDLDARVAGGTLTALPNIGASLAGAIAALHARRPLDKLERLRAAWPALVVQLAGAPGIGVIKARKLHAELGPASIGELIAACEAGRVRTLPGFGVKSEANLLEALRGLGTRGAEILVGEARDRTEALVAYLARAPAVRRAVAAGPARRWIERVDRLVVAVETDDPAAVIDHLARHPEVSEVTGAPPVVEASMATGPRLAVHLAAPGRFGLAVVLATGPEAHVAALAARAAARGASLIETAADDEAALYQALALPTVPPEVREGTDELNLAARGDLDRLIRRADVRGVVHCHTVYSDGKHTIEEMARAAEAQGMAYLTITDHSPAAGYAGGLDVERLRAQWDEIARVQEQVSVRLLRGSEVDILEDGALDLPDAVLDELDVVIASIHRRHALDERGMTARIVRAMRHPRFKIWGHPLGRLVLSRPPIPCRFDEVLDAIAASPVAIEISGDPHRLDLEPDRVREAHARGVRFVLSTDAHSIRGLEYIDAAVGLARRARLTPADVLNTLSAHDFARAVAARP